MAKPIQVFIVTIQEGENVDYKIVDDSTFTVGRSLDATLAFSDQNISRIHLIVTLKHNKIWIEDQGSANGTFVNDQKIPSQKTVSVEPGDKVKIGKSEIYLSFNLLEKCFKKEEIVNKYENTSTDDNPKEALIDVNKKINNDFNIINSRKRKKFVELL